MKDTTPRSVFPAQIRLSFLLAAQYQLCNLHTNVGQVRKTCCMGEISRDNRHVIAMPALPLQSHLSGADPGRRASVDCHSKALFRGDSLCDHMTKLLHRVFLRQDT
jgi:hypothetical protein